MNTNSTLCRCALGTCRSRFHAAVYSILHVESVTASEIAMFGRIFGPLGFPFLFEHFTSENRCKPMQKTNNCKADKNEAIMTSFSISSPMSKNLKISESYHEKKSIKSILYNKGIE